MFESKNTLFILIIIAWWLAGAIYIYNNIGNKHGKTPWYGWPIGIMFFISVLIFIAVPNFFRKWVEK